MALKHPIGRPVEFTGKVLDQRNNLTGPDDGEKTDFPERPKHVSIQPDHNPSSQ